MASVPVPNVAEIDIRYDINGQPAENTLYAEYTGTITGAILDALAVAVEDWFVDEMLPLLVDALVYRETHVRDLSAGSGFQALANGEAGATGAGTGTPYPGSVAWAVKFVTGLAGRSFRGRNYVSGLSSATVLGNILDPAFASAVVGAYQMLLTGGGILPADWQWVVVSRVSGGVPRVTGLTTPVNAVGYTDLVVDSQRNRTRS